MSLAEGASDTEHNIKQEEEQNTNSQAPTGPRKKNNDKSRQVSASRCSFKHLFIIS